MTDDILPPADDVAENPTDQTADEVSDPFTETGQNDPSEDGGEV